MISPVSDTYPYPEHGYTCVQFTLVLQLRDSSYQYGEQIRFVVFEVVFIQCTVTPDT